MKWNKETKASTPPEVVEEHIDTVLNKVNKKWGDYKNMLQDEKDLIVNEDDLNEIYEYIVKVFRML